MPADTEATIPEALRALLEDHLKDNATSVAYVWIQGVDGAPIQPAAVWGLLETGYVLDVTVVL